MNNESLEVYNNLRVHLALKKQKTCAVYEASIIYKFDLFHNIDV